MKKWFLLLGVALYFGMASAQPLSPGFDAREYLTALSIAFGKYDSMNRAGAIAPDQQYRQVYRSPTVGLDNQWSLYSHKGGGRALLNIRGTVGTTASWLANVYSVMVPATGQLRLTDSTVFTYKLAADEAAAVHLGWLIALGSMAPDMERQIKEQYAGGVREFLLMGHSQGAAINFLLRSYLYYRTQEGALPTDIRYKTYCSAAPKPGNLAYAYDFDRITAGGYGLTVVNAADWVPETPFTIQQITDMNPLNPFTTIKQTLRQQKWAIRLYAGMVYNKLDRSTRRAARRYRKYLGDKVGRQVGKLKPQLRRPTVASTLNYVRAGTPVVLYPNAAYYTDFPNDPARRYGIWNHHTFLAYVQVLRTAYADQLK